jgi:hypothetical protein
MLHPVWMRLAVLLLVFLSRVAGAYLQSGLPLEQLTASSDVIVKVTVSEVRPLEVLPESPRFAMAATIVAVMKQDGEAIPEQQVFEAFGRGEFVPELRADGEDSKLSLLLFLQRDAADRLQIINDRHAILPVFVASAGTPATPASVPRGLFDEFHAVAGRHADPLIRARYIALMAAFAVPADAQVFDQLATSEDPWVRLASALAAARIDPQPSRMEAVMRAFDSRLAYYGGQPDLFVALFSDVEHVARCRAFGMDEAMTLRARAYLPIYRFFLDYAEMTCVSNPPTCPGLKMSMEALAAVGTEADLLRVKLFRLNNGYSGATLP